MNEGKKDRRDPIRAIKPRNFVAKNASATTSGAGVHKDKKKAMKQGETKHKNKEYAEGLQTKLNVALAEAGSPAQQAAIAINMKKHHQKPKSEEIDQDEYSDEAGMSYGSLHTIARAANGLLDTIKEGDNLPEWCQEKISLAEDYLVTVWDYLQSEKEQGIAENKRRMSRAAKGNEKYGKDGMKALAKAGREGASEKKLDTIRDKYDNYNEGLKDPKDNPCWKGYKPVGTKKKGGRTVPNCVPKESWTHDTLAAQLFETENTYEDRLANLLNKKLNK
jgi:hypothetical protein